MTHGCARGSPGGGARGAAVGAPRSPRCSPTPAASVVVWARREEAARSIREDRRNPEYLPHAVLPAGIGATTDPLEALDGADLVVDRRCRRKPCAANLARMGPGRRDRFRRHPGEPDEGHRTGHRQADEPGHRRGRRRRRRSGRGGDRTRTSPGDRPGPDLARRGGLHRCGAGRRRSSTPSPRRTAGRTPTTT